MHERREEKIVTKPAAQAPDFRHGVSGRASHVFFEKKPRLSYGASYNESEMEYKVSYKSNRNVVYSCKYHVVWTPKYRRKVLVEGVDKRLKEIIQGEVEKMSCEVMEMEVMPDHVHLLIEVDPQFGIHRAIRQIKGSSSRILRREFAWLRSRLPTLWSNSYFVSTVGGAPLEIVKQYIENQKNV